MKQQAGDVSEQEKEDMQDENAIPRRIVMELIDDFLLNNCNPFTNENVVFEPKIPQTKTENELFKIQQRCQTLGLQYKSEDFIMSDVWWLQQNPVDPYTNISYNKVPPTDDLKKSGKTVLIFGTSITDQSLNKKKLEECTGKYIKIKKCFTISKEHAKIRPELNIEDVASKEIKKEVDFVIIEVGVNEVSNLNSKQKYNEKKLVVKEMVNKLMEQARKITEVKPVVKVVLLKQTERNDSLEKKIWRNNMNIELVKQVEEEKSNIVVKDLGMYTRNEKEKVELFGKLGDVKTENGKAKKVDQVHLRGVKGNSIYTEKFVNIVKSLDTPQKPKICPTKEWSRRKEGSIPTFTLPPSNSTTFCCSTSTCPMCKDEIL